MLGFTRPQNVFPQALSVLESRAYAAVGPVRADFNSVPETRPFKWLVLHASTEKGGCVGEGVEEKSTY
jgi:hypothetical protein